MKTPSVQEIGHFKETAHSLALSLGGSHQAQVQEHRELAADVFGPRVSRWLLARVAVALWRRRSLWFMSSLRSVQLLFRLHHHERPLLLDVDGSELVVSPSLLLQISLPACTPGCRPIFARHKMPTTPSPPPKGEGGLRVRRGRPPSPPNSNVSLRDSPSAPATPPPSPSISSDSPPPLEQLFGDRTRALDGAASSAPDRGRLDLWRKRRARGVPVPDEIEQQLFSDLISAAHSAMFGPSSTSDGNNSS